METLNWEEFCAELLKNQEQYLQFKYAEDKW
jgi:hypothetical protein